MNAFSDKKIIESWQRNVAPWVTAVRTGSIASRTQVTNQAIVAAVLQCAPTSVLDLGCGEGWLVRELAASNISACGIDAIAELILAAEQIGVGRFRQLAYEALTAEALTERFDCLVANFSLLGERSVRHVFAQASALLKPAGPVPPAWLCRSGSGRAGVSRERAVGLDHIHRKTKVLNLS